jgi:hypothetical protein
MGKELGISWYILIHIRAIYKIYIKKNDFLRVYLFFNICIYVYDHCVCCYYIIMIYSYFTIIVILFNCAYTDFCGINRPGFLGDVFTNDKFCQKKSNI